LPQEPDCLRSLIASGRFYPLSAIQRRIGGSVTPCRFQWSTGVAVISRWLRTGFAQLGNRCPVWSGNCISDGVDANFPIGVDKQTEDTMSRRTILTIRVVALGLVAANASAQHIAPNTLLTIDQNRATVVDASSVSGAIA
jgi:hypothetical protein